MFKQLIECFTHIYIKCRAKCSCSNCCMSECMAEEGSVLAKQNSSASLNVKKSIKAT